MNGQSQYLMQIVKALEYFKEIVEVQICSTSPDKNRLLSAYLESRRAASAAMKEYLSEPDAEAQLEKTVSAINEEMETRYGRVLPQKYLRVRGYRGAHCQLLSYLVRNYGDPVAASYLRVLTGDQVHTERRVRELRDLGFSISWTKTYGENHYVLDSPTPSLSHASRNQALKNIKNDRKISGSEKSALLRRI